MWGGRGAVALPRAVAWRSGEPVQNGAFSNRLGKREDPKRHDDVDNRIIYPGI